MPAIPSKKLSTPGEWDEKAGNRRYEKTKPNPVNTGELLPGTLFIKGRGVIADF
jgi:hypothetical protein